MKFRRRMPRRVSRRSRMQLALFLLTSAGLVLALLSATPAAAMSAAAKAPTSGTTSTRLRVAAKTATSTSGAKAVKTQRACAAPKKGRLECFALKRTDITEPTVLRADAVSPDATPSGYGPSSLVSAYKLPTSGGSGATVAVVDAYNDPNAAADLAVYRSQYGLPACTVANGCFSQVNQNGATSPLPASAPANNDWAAEESLDLDMVSAACPNCHIILVEAKDDSGTGLYVGQNAAVSLGAKFISNSWGGTEYSSDTSMDSSYFNHPGVATTVSSGDAAYGAQYPATSQYVTAVGGTSLKTASNTRGWSETVWKTSSSEATGSGCSAYDPKPSWQTTVTTGCSERAEADVAADADPATGVAIYDTFNSAGGWNVYGGTSAAAPFVAGVYALAGTPASGTYPASYPYSHASNLFDVTSGNNGSCSPSELCTAGTGWDGPTGLGTPNGTAAFSSSGGSTGNTVTVTNPGNQSAKVGTPLSLQISAVDSANVPLTYSTTSLPAGLSINSSNGLISGTPTATATTAVTVTAKDSTGASGSASFTITVSTTGTGCSSSQLLGNPGFETGSASPWTATAGVISANGSGETSHSGTYFAWLDGYGTTHTDTLSQSVTIPAACTNTSLTFYLHIDTAETTTSTQYDKLTVTATPSGGSPTTLATFSNLNHNTGYTLETESLAADAGKTVTIQFSGTEDSSLQTSFVIDDTAATTS